MNKNASKYGSVQLPLPITTSKVVTVNPIAIKIKTDKRTWNKWKEVQSKISALKEKAEQLESAMEFPDAQTLAAKFDAKRSDRVTGMVCDRNSKLVGKFSLYYVNEFQMPGTWKKRIY